MDEMCTRLDALALRQLDLMNESIGQSLALESILQDGRFQLSRTRHLIGYSNALAAQIDNREMDADTRVSIDADKCEFRISRRTNNDSDDHATHSYSPFGILEPQTAKLAKKRFANAVELVCELATTRAQLISIGDEYTQLMKRKKQQLAGGDK